MTSAEREARFMRSLLAASDDCIKVLDLDGKLTFMSEGGQRVMEVSDFNVLAGCPWPDFWADAGNNEARHAISEAQAGRSYRFQGAANTATGNPRYWDVKVSPIIGPDGKPERILSVSRDITELKAAEDRLLLLAQELKHRMKNTIAMIQAIAGQTLRGDDIPLAAREAFNDRLRVLAEAQDLLMPSAWARGPIHGVVERSVAPHELERFEIVGPQREISSKCAVALALALHEMATNSVKYGALRADGRVRVEWSVDDEFRFTWTEAGGPKVEEPTRKGFGSRMIEQVLASYFRGTGSVEYRPEGLVFTLVAPLDALDDESGA